MIAPPAARFRFIVQARESLHLPEYAGSMLRGAFGHALRRLTLLPHKDNELCALNHTCPYCQIFLTVGNKPASYVIEPPVAGECELHKGEQFAFSLVLIGNTLDHLPLVILAFEGALKRGLGKQRTSCTLLRVNGENGDILWSADDRDVTDYSTELPQVKTGGTIARLRFITPLRLQRTIEQRKVILRRESLDAHSLLIALARRYHWLCESHPKTQGTWLDFSLLTEAAANIELDTTRMQWRDYKRYSSRQKQSTPLGGLVGDVILQGPLNAFHQLLHAGQWLHVGKETVFGLGHYQLEWI